MNGHCSSAMNRRRIPFPTPNESGNYNLKGVSPDGYIVHQLGATGQELPKLGYSWFLADLALPLPRRGTQILNTTCHFFRHSGFRIHLPSKPFELPPSEQMLTSRGNRKCGIEPCVFLVITLMVCQVPEIVSININDVNVIVLVLKVSPF